MYHGHEVPAKFFEPCRQSAHVFHFTKEPLNDVALRVKIDIMRDRLSCIALRWNDSKRAFISDLAPDPSAAISFVGDNSDWRSVPLKKGVHDLAVVNMAAGNGEPQRAAFGVYGRMNFTCATTA